MCVGTSHVNFCCLCVPLLPGARLGWGPLWWVRLGGRHRNCPHPPYRGCGGEGVLPRWSSQADLHGWLASA